MAFDLSTNLHQDEKFAHCLCMLKKAGIEYDDICYTLEGLFLEKFTIDGPIKRKLTEVIEFIEGQRKAAESEIENNTHFILKEERLFLHPGSKGFDVHFVPRAITEAEKDITRHTIDVMKKRISAYDELKPVFEWLKSDYLTQRRVSKASRTETQSPSKKKIAKEYILQRINCIGLNFSDIEYTAEGLFLIEHTVMGEKRTNFIELEYAIENLRRYQLTTINGINNLLKQQEMDCPCEDISGNEIEPIKIPVPEIIKRDLEFEKNKRHAVVAAICNLDDILYYLKAHPTQFKKDLTTTTDLTRTMMVMASEIVAKVVSQLSEMQTPQTDENKGTRMVVKACSEPTRPNHAVKSKHRRHSIRELEILNPKVVSAYQDYYDKHTGNIYVFLAEKSKKLFNEEMTPGQIEGIYKRAKQKGM